MVAQEGRLYWDVLAMYRHFVTCLDELEAKGVRPDSIGIDTWGVDLGCIGADGSLLGLPRCYRDPLPRQYCNQGVSQIVTPLWLSSR